MGDLTGTSIRSDKPVAVFSGHTATDVPNQTVYADHLCEQLPPVNTWGRHFITMPLAGRFGGDTFRVLASADSTSVSIDGRVVATLNRGQVFEKILLKASSIAANKPVLVAQFANGAGFDDGPGDPFLALVPATDQFGGSYVLTTPLDYDIETRQYMDWFIYGSYVSLTVPSNGLSSLVVDGIPATNLPTTPLDGTGFVGVRLPVTTGTHTYSGDVPFGLLMYGWGIAESYAYLGGLYSDTLEPGTSMDLVQATPYSPVGREKTVIARTTDARGLPLSDLEITFEVTGANPTSGRVRADQFGAATFAYIGTNAGVDQITATLLNLQQRVTNTVISSANQPPVVNAGPDHTILFGTNVLVQGTATDDGQPGAALSVSWRTLAGPVPARFANSNAEQTTVSFDLPGTYVLELTASDSMFSTRDTVAVTVQAVNLLPTISVRDPYLDYFFVGDYLWVRGAASDFDGEIVRVELFLGDTKVAETTTDNFNEWEFNYQINTAGIVPFHFEAVDERGARAVSQTYTLIIHEFHVLLHQLTPFSFVGTEKSISARVQDQFGTPFPWNWVYYTITGANPMQGYALAGENAEATIVYTGTNPGEDVITAATWERMPDMALTNTWVISSTNQPPVVTASAPATAVYRRPVPLHGTVSDDGLPIGQTNFFWRVAAARLPGVVIADTNALDTTVTFEWADSGEDYVIELVATDTMFASRAAARIRVTDNVPPTVALTMTPETNQVFIGQTLQLTADVADEDDYYVQVDFYEGATLLGQQYWYTWWPYLDPQPYTIQRKGMHTFAVRATDARGASVLSEPIQVFCGARPAVTWINPTSGQSLLAGQTQNLAVQATDADGTVASVTYYLLTGTNLTALGQATGPQFALPWTPTTTGTVTLVARAMDNDGSPSEDALIPVDIVLPASSLTIVNPVPNALLDLGELIVIAASVDDPANSVTNFEFRLDGLALTNVSSSAVPWIPTPPGAHSLQVFADDVLGRRIASPAVTVTVTNLLPPTVMVLSPTNGADFAAGAVVPAHVEASDADGVITNLLLFVDGNALAAVTNSSVLDLALTNLSGWHSVSAQAIDNTASAAISPEARFFVQRAEDGSLPAPTGLVAQATSATEVQLAWSGVPTNGAAYAVVERWSPARLAWVEIDQPLLLETSYTDGGLVPETLYRYRVATVNEFGRRSPYSNEAQATTRTVVPGYSVVDLTEAIASTLLAQQPFSNPMTNAGFNNFDQRRTKTLGGNYARAELGTNANTVLLATARFKERWPQIQLDFDPVLVTPGSILPQSGFLSGPGGAGVTVSEASANLFAANDPHRAVKAFLHEHSALFGHGEEALAQADPKRDYVAPGSGARTVVWQQKVAGVPVFSATLVGHITQAGELAALSSLFVPQPDQAAEAAMLALLNANAALPVASSNSLVAAVANVGEIFAPEDVVVKTQPEGAARKQTFTGTKGIKGDAYAELTWFPARRTQLRLCWQVLLASRFQNEMYLTLVAADTGEIVYRRNLTTTSTEASYRVYTSGSPSPFLPGWSTPNIGQPPQVGRTLVTVSALDTNASPLGWIADADNETRGNNVDAAVDRNDDDAPEARPVGNPARVFDFALDLSGAPRGYGDAAAVQLFYWNNWMHDTLYGFGFNEAAGNFQNNNFSRGGAGGDAVVAQAQDGLDLNDRSHINNANMSTPPDGYAPRMQMYVFDGAAPDRDGSLDAEIVLHEYTHGVSSRLIGGGAGIDALATAGMGEGWSDFLALAMLAPASGDVDGVYPMGGYATHHAFGTTFEENYYYGIRRYPYCTDTNKNPLTFRDIDPLQAQPHDGVPLSALSGPFRAGNASEVHRQGEVWAQMLWEVRAALIRKHGAVTGNSLAIQLVIDGLRLAPPNPNYVQARDAILLADRIWTGGNNAPEIWAAFARRGLGFGAKAPDSRTTRGVRESYDVQPALTPNHVEITGGNGNGTIEAGEDNSLIIHVRNQGSADASQVTAQISTLTAGVALLQQTSAYPDIPRNESRPNTTVFQIQTSAGFVEGTPIDLTVVVTSPQANTTTQLRLFTGNPDPELPYDNYSGLAEATAAQAQQRNLSPLDLENMEPLWMADDASCLLKVGENRYVLWHPNRDPEEVNYPGFLAHRLTRHGTVVGQLQLANTTDAFGNQLGHTHGAKWVSGENGGTVVPLTMTGYHYKAPKNALVEPRKGTMYVVADPDPGPDGYVTDFPHQNDVWDLNASGEAAGFVSVYVRPKDQNNDGIISDRDVELGLGHLIGYDAAGKMDWETVSERSFEARLSENPTRQVVYNALLTTAAIFPTDPDAWRWLGPLSFVPGNAASAIAMLLNDAGVVGGAGAFVTGNPDIDQHIPTHAFRWSTANGEFAEGMTLLTLDAQPRLVDLGVLSGGLYSQPYAINAAGEMVGSSDSNQIVAGTVQLDPYNTHAVYWAPDATTPEGLANFGAVGPALSGYSWAFSINDNSQIVGTSYRPAEGNWTDISAGVLWQRNANQPGGPAKWEMTDLNKRLTTEDWLVSTAVGINGDELILASGQKAIRTVQGELVKWEPRAMLLIPLEVNTRDRLISGTFKIPRSGTYGLNFVNEQSGEVLATIADIRNDPSIFANEEAMMEAPERAGSKGAFYRDEKDPNLIHFTLFSKMLGKVRVDISKDQQPWLKHKEDLISDPEFRDFLIYADERIHTLEMPETPGGAPAPKGVPENLQFPHLGPMEPVGLIEQILDWIRTSVGYVQQGTPPPNPFRAGVGISPYHGVPRGTMDALASQPLELKHPELVAKSTEAFVKSTAKYTLVIGTGATTGVWDGVKGDVEGAVQGWRAVLGFFKDPVGRAKQLRQIVKSIADVKLSQIPPAAKNIWNGFKSKAEQNTPWKDESTPPKAEGVTYYIISYGGGYGGEQIVVSSATAGLGKFGTVGKVISTAISGPFDIGNLLSGGKKLKGAFTKHFSQHVDGADATRILNRVDDVIETKFLNGPNKGKSPGQVIEEALDRSTGGHEQVMEDILKNPEIAALMAAKNPIWEEQAARYLVRTADAVGELGGDMSADAMRGFIRAYDLLALTAKKGDDRYDLLMKILKRNAADQNITPKQLLEDLARAPRDKFAWDLPATTRGVAIEARLAKTDYGSWTHVGAENHGFFELFDFQKGTTWVSLKSVDHTSPTALTRMQKHVDKLGDTVVLNPGQTLVLDIRVPPAYAGNLDDLVQYGLARGVRVEIKKFP